MTKRPHITKGRYIVEALILGWVQKWRTDDKAEAEEIARDLKTPNRTTRVKDTQETRRR